VEDRRLPGEPREHRNIKLVVAMPRGEQRETTLDEVEKTVANFPVDDERENAG